MSQATSTAWSGAVIAPFRQINTGVLVDFNKTTASGVNFFTVNISTIGGQDLIKGGGDSVTFFDKFNYQDYTQWATDWSVTRQIGQFPYGLIMAQADIRFDNTSKMFLPNYDATIGSGILPNRPIKISAGIGVDSLQQFVGFTGQPELGVVDRYLQFHAFDVMDYLNNYSFTASGITYSGTLQNVTTSGVIGYYLQQLGFANNQFRMDLSLQNPIGYVNVLDRKFGDVLRDLIEAEQGLLFADETGVINFWNRQHIYTQSGTGYKFNYNYSNTIDIQYQNTAIINDVLVEANPRAVRPNKRVYVQQTTQILPPGTTTTLFISFSDLNGALPVTSVITPTAGAGTSSYFKSNISSDGTAASGDAYLTVIDVYLFGTTYKITFNNSSTSTLYLTDLVLYGTPAEVKETIQQRWTDTVSAQAYGRNPSNNGEPLLISNDYIQDDSTAQSLAYQLVQAYKDPRTHFTVQVFPNPALQIGDYGTITIEDTNSVHNVFITSKKDVLAPNGDYQQELTLEERVSISYFTINQSIINGLDSIAP